MAGKYEITIKQGNKVVWEETSDHFQACSEVGIEKVNGQPARQNGAYRGDMRFATGKPYDEFETDVSMHELLPRCEFCNSYIYGDAEKQKQAKLDILKKMDAMRHRYKLAAQAKYPWMRFRTWRFWKPWEKILLHIGWTASRMGRHDILLKITDHIFKEPTIIYTTSSFFKNDYAWPSFKEGTSTEEILKTTF